MANKTTKTKESKLKTKMRAGLIKFGKKVVAAHASATKELDLANGHYVEYGKELDVNGLAHFVTVPQSPKSKFDTWYNVYEDTLKSETHAQEIWETARELGEGLKVYHQKMFDAGNIGQEFSRWIISIKRNQMYYASEQQGDAAKKRAESKAHASNCKKVMGATTKKKGVSIDAQFKNKCKTAASRLKELQKVIKELQELSVDKDITEPQAKLVEPMAQAMEDIIPSFAAVGIEADTIWLEE